MLLAFLLDSLIAILSAAGVYLSFLAQGWGVFQYYTLCSNLLLLLACAVQAAYEARVLCGRALFVPSWVRVFKYVAVSMTTVTFVVVVFVLAPLMGGPARLPWLLTHRSMLFHHTLCPLLGLASFLFADRVSLPDRRASLLAFAPTALYAVVFIVLNIARAVVGPYPFLRVYEQPVWASVLWLVVIPGAAFLLAEGVRRLSLRLAAPHPPGQPDPEELAWTEDGYLCNQDALFRYTYRAIPANHNSCGPVAAFNLRRRAGHDVRIDDVIAEMDGMHLLRVPGPTRHGVMRRYLRKYLPGWRETSGRAACLAAMEHSRMGVVRYHEQRVPHYVAYCRTEDGTFRFFNVSDDKEDDVMRAENFGAEHLRGGSVRLIWWE